MARRAPRKRAPGGGRKPRGPYQGSSVMLAIRVRPEVKAGLERLAKERGQSLSQQAQRALTYWVDRHSEPQLHNQALADATKLVAERVEHDTGKLWLDDQFTGEALKTGVINVMLRYIPSAQLDQPPIVPARIKETAARLGGEHPSAERVGEAAAGFVAALSESALNEREEWRGAKTMQSFHVLYDADLLPFLHRLGHK
jgi:predicted transcriptional regulator